MNYTSDRVAMTLSLNFKCNESFFFFFPQNVRVIFYFSSSTPRKPPHTVNNPREISPPLQELSALSQRHCADSSFPPRRSFKTQSRGNTVMITTICNDTLNHLRLRVISASGKFYSFLVPNWTFPTLCRGGVRSTLQSPL